MRLHAYLFSIYHEVLTYQEAFWQCDHSKIMLCSVMEMQPIISCFLLKWWDIWLWWIFKQIQLRIYYRRIDNLFVFLTVYIKRIINLCRGFPVLNLQHNESIRKSKGTQKVYTKSQKAMDMHMATWHGLHVCTSLYIHSLNLNRILREQRFSGPRHHPGGLHDVTFFSFCIKWKISNLKLQSFYGA